MSKICILFFPFCLSIFFIPTFSFATPREVIIEQALSQMESAIAVGPQQQYLSADSTTIQKKLDGAKTAYKDKSKRERAMEVQMQKTTFFISGGYNANHMHYKEFRSNSHDTLDEDYGKLKGFYSKVGYRSPNYYEIILCKPFLEAYFRRSANLITYDGASSAGPLQFDDRHAKIFRYGLKIGGYKDFVSTKGDYFGYLDIGERIWYRGENRVVQGVLDYAEKYWWYYLGVGAGINYKFIPKLTTGIELEAMFSNSDLAKMRADLFEGGTFELKNVRGTELQLPIKYHLLKNISFDLTPYFTWWWIKESDPVLISGSYYIEPDSRTHIEGLLTGFTYNF